MGSANAALQSADAMCYLKRPRTDTSSGLIMKQVETLAEVASESAQVERVEGFALAEALTKPLVQEPGWAPETHKRTFTVIVVQVPT